MIVTSDLLERSAAEMRRRHLGLVDVPQIGRAVSVKQLDTAVRLIREAEPSVITSPRQYRGTWERTAFIEHDSDPTVLRLRVGLLSSEVYRIRGDGELTGGGGV